MLFCWFHLKSRRKRRKDASRLLHLVIQKVQVIQKRLLIRQLNLTVLLKKKQRKRKRNTKKPLRNIRKKRKRGKKAKRGT